MSRGRASTNQTFFASESPSQINMGDRPKRMSCPPRRFVEEFCELREKKMEKVERKRKTDGDFYDVGVSVVDTTRRQLKIHFAGFSHEDDEWRGYDNERNYFPFVRLEKMFFPAEGPLGDRGNIFNFTGDSLSYCKIVN